MLSSGIIDLAIGLTFVFGVTAAVASAVTELIARYIGLRGAYLLGGLRELVDGGEVSTVLGQAGQDYQFVQGMISRGMPPRTQPAPAELSPAELSTAEASAVTPPSIKPVSVSTLSATGALLGGGSRLAPRPRAWLR